VAWCGYDATFNFTSEVRMTAVPADDAQSTSAPQPAAASTPVPAPKPPPVTYEQFAQLDLRVARVVEAREHPNANKLLLLKIRVGDVEKQIVAGIRGHYEPASLVGRLIAVVHNLAPAVIRGEESNGMLLAASDEKGVVLLQPDREIADGSRIK
jgi:methionyl-tRNA synthetase